MDYKIVRNDITEMGADAVVLPANIGLIEGSGTSRAIYLKAGEEELKNECKKIPSKERYIGNAVPTKAFNLNAKYIIHAIVPKWKGGGKNEYNDLTKVYNASLILADQMECESIAFPILGSGNNGFDIRIAFQIAKKSIELFTPKKKLKTVFLVVYNQEMVKLVHEFDESIEEYIDEGYVLTNYETYDTFAEIMKKVKKCVSESENQKIIQLVAKLIKP